LNNNTIKHQALGTQACHQELYSIISIPLFARFQPEEQLKTMQDVDYWWIVVNIFVNAFKKQCQLFFSLPVNYALTS
jgi:hypothetical protein